MNFIKGVRLVIDSKALMVLVGTEMDLVEDELKSEFIFKNPNAKVLKFRKKQANNLNLGQMWLWRKFPYLKLYFCFNSSPIAFLRKKLKSVTSKFFKNLVISR